MTTAVVDAGPLIYLGLLDTLDVLPRIFQKVIVPGAVVHELETLKNPSLAPIRVWAGSLPAWIDVQDPVRIDPMLRGLQAGESAAISLARELQADIILIDDGEARRVAISLGGKLRVVGTLGVLDSAADRGLVEDLPGLLHRLLHETPFRCGPKCLQIVAEMNRRDLERRRP